MLKEPPANFDLNAFYQGIYLFQSWELFSGFRTEGPKDVVANLDGMGFPADLTGKRVLDIAPWNGFFSFECARRGAAEVISVGPEDPTDTGFEQTRALLGIENVRYIRGSVYDLAEAEIGTFDIVLFLGLIYHLRHPLLALDRIHDVCRDQMYVDTPIIDVNIYDRTLPEPSRQAIVAAGPVIHELPLLYYTGKDETGDPYNWFMPNRLAFRSMVESSGFTIVHENQDGGGWRWIAATKGVRPFTEGLEGYNPYAAARR